MSTVVKHPPLRKYGYRFVYRVNENYIILASLDAKNYMLFQEIDSPVEDDPKIRGQAFRFVRPITENTDSLMYLLASTEDGKRRKKGELAEV